MNRFQPIRPGYPGMDWSMSSSGSTPNLNMSGGVGGGTASGFSTIGSQWNSTSHLISSQVPPSSGGRNVMGGDPRPNYRMPHNAMPGAGPGGVPYHQMPGNAANHMPVTPVSYPNNGQVSMNNNQQPLGYLVAYTPEQVHEILTAKFQVPPSPSAHQMGAGTATPASPGTNHRVRPVSTFSTVRHKFKCFKYGCVCSSVYFCNELYVIL